MKRATMNPYLPLRPGSFPLPETSCSHNITGGLLLSGRLSEISWWVGGWTRGMSETQVGAILGTVGRGRAWKWEGGISPVEPGGRNISTLYEVSRFCVQPSMLPWTVGETRTPRCNFQDILESSYNNKVISNFPREAGNTRSSLVYPTRFLTELWQ